MIRPLRLALVPLALAACDRPAQRPAEPPADSAAAALVPAPAADAPAADVPGLATVAPAALPAGVSVTGAPDAARRWTDGQGEHLVVLSRTEEVSSAGEDGEEVRARELYAAGFTRAGDAWRRTWLYADTVAACEFDIMLDFAPGSLRVTDADGDGTAEATFAHRRSCRSDLSEEDLVLVVQEGTARHALRGRTDYSQDMPEYEPAPPPTSEETFAGAPALLAHARREWPRHLRSLRWPEDGVP